jgi:hypothetical protein
MATLPEGLTQKDIDRLAQLDAGIKKLEVEYNNLKDKVKQVHQDAGLTGKKTLVYPSEKYGSVIVDLNEQKRLDEEALIKAHPFEKFPQYWHMQFDKSLVDATVLAKFKTNIIPTLSIKVAQ